MAISESEFKLAQERGLKVRAKGYAVAAKYAPSAKMIVVKMASGMVMSIPVRLIEGLDGAAPEALAEIEINSSGLGLHWPKLDVDLYVPSLMKGKGRSQKSSAASLGALGGKVRSKAKSAAARENGKKGGRPRKVA